MRRDDLVETIAFAINAEEEHDAVQVAARAAMTWFAEVLAKHGITDMPLSHTDDCDWMGDRFNADRDPCSCGFDDLHYDLIWARMYPTPRKEKTVTPDTEPADPYDEPVFVQGHNHSEPVCAWPDCETYLTPAQMAERRAGALTPDTETECTCESMGGRFGAHRDDCPQGIAWKALATTEEQGQADRTRKEQP